MKTWMCALMLALSTGASANFNPDGTIQKVIPTLRGVAFGVIFTKDGFPALFSDVSKLPIILLTIFAFSMSDTFDTIGTVVSQDQYYFLTSCKYQ